MTDADVRLGRRWAHGRRFAPVRERCDASDVLLALGSSADKARGLLARVLRATGKRGVRVKPEEAEVTQALAAAGIVRLEEVVAGTVAAPRWIPWRVALPPEAQTEIRDILGCLDPAAERASLVMDLSQSLLLAGERDLLAAQASDAPLTPPSGSALAGTGWTAYTAALRVAAEWERARQDGERLSARELAARALGSSKAWTSARRAAFERLVGTPLAQAVSVVERFVRVRGPLRWRLGARAGDARSTRPWIGLPTTALSEIELDTSEATGTFVVENLETFEEVARRTEVAERWICVYGGGYLGNAEAGLVGRLELPVVTWCDLDPDGIRIAADLERRSGLAVELVAMEPTLLRGPYARPATDQQLSLARELVGTAPPAMRPLAAAIAAAGCVCEQEALHAVVLPDLTARLAKAVAQRTMTHP